MMRQRRFIFDVIALLMMGVLALTFWPARFGGDSTFVIVRGQSMEPALHDGAFVVVRAADSYDVGDILAYRIPAGEAAAGKMIIHRVIEVADDGLVMRGDNRTTNDSWLPSQHDVVGRVVMVAPGSTGRLLTVLPWTFCGLIGIGVIGLLWPRSRRAEKFVTVSPWPAPTGKPIDILG